MATCFVALACAFGVRSSAGMVLPFRQSELGWTGAQSSKGASLVLIMMAVGSPVAGRNRYGATRLGCRALRGDSRGRPYALRQEAWETLAGGLKARRKKGSSNLQMPSRRTGRGRASIITAGGPARHPRSGRRAFCVNGPWPRGKDESRELAAIDLAKSADVVHRRAWRPGDPVMRDNWLQARTDFLRDHARLLRRYAVRGQALDF